MTEAEEEPNNLEMGGLKAMNRDRRHTTVKQKLVTQKTLRGGLNKERQKIEKEGSKSN